ncbi:MAG: carbamate kinase [Patescibacteria group bacterium]
MKKYVIALGGNAITGNSYQKQLESAYVTLHSFIELLSNTENKIAITYGNGPQVGNILIQNSAAKRLTPEQPIYACVAQSQGLLSCIIQTALYNLLRKNDIRRDILGTITFIEVNPNDPAFNNPTKPIGPFYSKLEIRELLCQNNNHIFKKITDKTWRRAVPSPEPLKILDADAVKKIFESGNIPITCGGGGVPIINDGENFFGIDAVIDKDKASALLADFLDADVLIVLTNEPQVALNYKKNNEKRLDYMNATNAKKYLNEGHFAEGSMKPKIEAAICFVEKNIKRKALITDYNCLSDALQNKNGTWIYNKNGEEK